MTMLLLEITYHPNTSGTEGRAAIFIMITGSVFWNLLLSMTALTTFLNLKASIRQRAYLRASSFFVLPVLFVAGVAISVNDPSSLFSFWPSVVSFLIVHLFFFSLFNIKIVKPV
jgi:hypothetical protein